MEIPHEQSGVTMLILPLFALGLFGLGFSLAAIISPATPRGARLVASFPLGAAVFTLSLFCITQVSGFLISRPLIIAVLLAALIPSALAAGRAGRRPAEAAAARCGLTPLARVELIAIFSLFALLAIVGTFSPVWNWDVYLEYLPFARDIFKRGSLPSEASPIAPLVLPAMPPGHVLLIACGYILQGSVVHPWARCLSPLHGGLILILLYLVGRRHLGLSPEATLGGVLICLALPLFAELTTVPSSIIPFCFSALAALYFTLEYLGTRRRSDAALTGIFLGIAYWNCYAGAVLIACVFALFVISTAAGHLSGIPGLRGLRVPLSDIACIFSLALAMAAPHMIRNYLLFGNPVYPALYNIFGGVWINNWSVANLTHIIVPVGHFYLRLRWEIFNEGFFIMLLFALSIASWPWYRRQKSCFFILFCVGYLIFYLMLLTWPRSSGISLKLLLPAFIPAALLAGERMTRIIRREAPPWQLAIIMVVIPLWSAVMLHEEFVFLGEGCDFRPAGVIGVARGARALATDANELLLLAGIALCACAGKARRLGAGVIIFALACQPAGEGIYQLACHVKTCISCPGYSAWNAPSFPSYLPEAAWLDAHLPKNAVIGTYDNRSYLYPRKLCYLDSPPLWPIYQGLDVKGCIALLRQNGVTHLCLGNLWKRAHPLYGKSPIFDKLGDPRYFPVIHQRPSRQEEDTALTVYAVADDRSP